MSADTIPCFDKGERYLIRCCKAVGLKFHELLIGEHFPQQFSEHELQGKPVSERRPLLAFDSIHFFSPASFALSRMPNLGGFDESPRGGAA